MSSSLSWRNATLFKKNFRARRKKRVKIREKREERRERRERREREKAKPDPLGTQRSVINSAAHTSRSPHQQRGRRKRKRRNRKARN